MTVRKGELRAMLALLEKKDDPHRLQVRSGSAGTIIVATDGHLLGALRVSREPAAELQFAAPAAWWHEAMGPKRPNEDTKEITLTAQSDERFVFSDGASMRAPAESVRFPEGVAHVIKAAVTTPGFTAENETDKRPGQYNPKLLAKFGACLELLSGRTTRNGISAGLPLLQNRGAADPAVITPDGDHVEFVGLLMPFRAVGDAGARNVEWAWNWGSCSHERAID
jgi:hypothetical protein